MRVHTILLVSFVAMLGIGADSLADVLRTKDGRMLEGRVIKQDENVVIFEMIRFGSTVRLEFKPDEVASITEGPVPTNIVTPAEPAVPANVPPPSAEEPKGPPIIHYDGPTYYFAPMRGVVGEAVTASILERMLADAARRKPSVVVLYMDSPGGSVDEVAKLVNVIAAYKQRLRIVVWAKRAISAAAITSLAANEIYMHPTATFGAATAFRITPAGSAVAIEEKMQSVWRAQGRSAAEVGGHSPLLAEGMIDSSAGIYMHRVAGKPVLTSRPQFGSVIVKDPGKLLTLTGREAVASGLAQAVVEDLAELGKATGYAGWVECEGVGVPLAEWWEARREAGAKAWESHVKRLQLAMKEAVANDPSAFEDYRGSGDPQSVRLWNTRAHRCVDALKVAESELTKLARVVEEYPHLPVGRKEIEEHQAHIAGLRHRVDAARMRVPDAPKRR